MSTRSGVDIDLFSRTVCADVMMLVGATMAFAPGPVARLARPHRALSAASMSVVESEDTLQAADEVLESLLEVGAPTGMRRKMAEGLRQKQLAITDLVSSADGVTFQEDAWTRPKGGGGITRVLAGGNVWEKAGVALSVVHGTMPYQTFLTANPAAAKKAAEDGITGPDSGEIGYFATGLSCVMHPRNPMAPTMHFNYRYFETDDGIWWFGGGSDLTPSYLFEEDVKSFHGAYKAVCDKYDPEFYPRFKKWADEYFYIKHRGETRGLGGIFFDDLNDREPEELYNFAMDCLSTIGPAYVPIVVKHKDDEFTQKQKEWQQMRRGRYVEFNLVYDRGTIFGLKAGGRIESILMSLPETARWEYNHKVEEGSPEADILDAFKNPREWC